MIPQHYTDLLTMTRIMLVEGLTMGKQPFGQTISAITDAAVAFGTEDVHREHRTAPGFRVNRSRFTSLTELTEANKATAVTALFQPSKDESPLERLLADVLQASLAFAEERERMKDKNIEAIFQRILEATPEAEKGKQRMVDAELAEEFFGSLLKLYENRPAENNHVAEKCISYARRFFTEENLNVNASKVPSWQGYIRIFKNVVM